MGRSIQGLEDLHHGFPVDRVGQRHRGFAFETVTGTPAITWGDFEGVFDAGHSGTYLSGHNTRGWPSEAMQQNLIKPLPRPEKPQPAALCGRDR